MLVASGAEFGDACMAALGQLPQVIGNIRTAIGCGTVRRASGIAVQVTVGDPVYQGDVIETSADGRIEIRFIDGTVFNLSRDARVELSCNALRRRRNPGASRIPRLDAQSRPQIKQQTPLISAIIKP